MTLPNHLFELRRYRVADGRMQDEIDRALSCIIPLDKGGLGLFERYGIPAPIGLWRVISGPVVPCVVFIYQWPSAAARAQAFESFYGDRQWQEERARTNAGSEIVDRMDDLLLTGPPPLPMPAGLIYAFDVFAPDAVPDECLASFAPLCGNDPRHLSIRAYASVEEAMAHGDNCEERSLCELIPMGSAA